MPLDTRKTKHIAAKMTKINMSRTQSIVVVTKNSNGTTTATIYTAIWKPAQDADPLMDPATGAPGSPNTAGRDDIVAQFLSTDITLAQLRACIYMYPQTPYASEPASRYIITSITPKGLVAGGDRYVVTLTRQR